MTPRFFLTHMLAAFLAVLPQTVIAETNWTVRPEESSLTFEVAVGDIVRSGAFEIWQADIDFDPETPQDGVVSVTVDMVSVTFDLTTGQSMLPLPEWLDVTGHATAHFQGAGFTTVEVGRFTVNGQLDLKGTLRPLTIGLALIVDGGSAVADVNATLSRSDFGIGASVTRQEVGEIVTIHVHIAASLSES